MTDITEKISALPGTFRRGTLTDVPAVTALYRACAQAGQAEGSSVWDEEYPGEEEARADAESGALFVLEDGGALLSAVSLLPRTIWTSWIAGPGRGPAPSPAWPSRPGSRDRGSAGP